jgi:hypothetical protein
MFVWRLRRKGRADPDWCPQERRTLSDCSALVTGVEARTLATAIASHGFNGMVEVMV